MKIPALHILGTALFAGLLLGGCDGVIESNGSASLPDPESSARPVFPGGPGRGGFHNEPVITDITPFEAKAGETVVIKGKGFKKNQKGSTVMIGGVEADGIFSWAKDEISVVVPEGAQKGVVIVTVGGLPSNMWPLNVLWTAENPENVLVFRSENSPAYPQNYPQMVSDGLGGTIIVWGDKRNGNWDIYAQRVDSTGLPLWASDGVPISTAVSSQYWPQMISDGQGGAIITWKDKRGGSWEVYAQRVDSSGIPQWTPDGVPISTTRSSYPKIISGSVGGAIITWTDYRSGDGDIYAQSIDSSGAVQWTSGGVVISSTTDSQTDPQIAADGLNGAIIAWSDYRDYETDGVNIYAQRVDSTGAVQWLSDGVAVSSGLSSRFYIRVIPDSLRGVFVTWQDWKSSGWEESIDIYAQHLSGIGEILWGADGVKVSKEGYSGSIYHAVPDGRGGVFIAWEEYRALTNWKLYVQRLDESGRPGWAEGGVPVSISGVIENYPKITIDGLGGAIITWNAPKGGYGYSSYNVYAQRIDASGLTQWDPEGVAVSIAGEGQIEPKITSDGWGGAIIAWMDRRSGNWDIYAQGISGSGRQ